MTKRTLAELVGVTARSITFYESAEMDPAEPVLMRMADVLRFPPEFFAADDLEEIPEDAVSFRSLAKMTASQRHAATSAGTLAVALHDWISQSFRLPEPRVPRLGPGIDPETAAEVVRERWGLGEKPIANMIHLMEANGVRVFPLAEECAEVDAFSFRRGAIPFVFLNTQKTAERSRFDAAHELGHLVMHWHHDVPQGREAEQEAQAFASAFLMPAASILASAPRLASLAEIDTLKRVWRVAAAALIYRLHRLGVVSEWHYRTLNIEISKRGRTTEPHGIPRETSQILTKVFAALRRDGVGKAEIARAVHLLPDELGTLVFGLALLPVPGDGEGGEPSSPTLRLISGS